MSIPKIQEIENSLEWKEISATNITEGSSATYEEIKKAREVIIVHEKNKTMLTTTIPKILSDVWIKNQNIDIHASMSVNFTTGRVQNGSTSDTNTWIKKIIYR